LVRCVSGVLFSDYVRMIRATKDVDWSTKLEPVDLSFVLQRVTKDRWYPMASFERLGEVILHEVAKGDLNLVRVWGRFSADPLHDENPELVAPSDPVDTLMRFRVLRSTYFDFEALRILTLTPDHAHIVIHYHMGPVAEEAACYQTMGFFERLVELAGADGVDSRFVERSWGGDARTVLELRWKPLGRDGVKKASPTASGAAEKAPGSRAT
jgi:hypothetical protein